jgi:hypothetical protein
MLSNLIYFSERDFGCPDVEVERIVQESAARNRKRDITGFLVADSQYFLQILEGDRKALSALFDTIQADFRHRDVVLAAFSEIDVRRFPEWGMACVGDPEIIKIASAPFVGDQRLAPASLTGEQLLQILVAARARLTAPTR